MTLFYLSFVDTNKPRQWLGGCVVYGDDQFDAIQSAWKHNCNPGGEVLVVKVPDDKPPPKKYINVLMNRKMLEELEEDLTRLYSLPPEQQGFCDQDGGNRRKKLVS